MLKKSILVNPISITLVVFIIISLVIIVNTTKDTLDEMTFIPCYSYYAVPKSQTEKVTTQFFFLTPKKLFGADYKKVFESNEYSCVLIGKDGTTLDVTIQNLGKGKGGGKNNSFTIMSSINPSEVNSSVFHANKLKILSSDTEATFYIGDTIIDKRFDSNNNPGVYIGKSQIGISSNATVYPIEFKINEGVEILDIICSPYKSFFNNIPYTNTDNEIRGKMPITYQDCLMAIIQPVIKYKEDGITEYAFLPYLYLGPNVEKDTYKKSIELNEKYIEK